MNYFDKLPTITYNGQVAKNLLSRASLSEKTKSNKLAYYPYTMDTNDKVDMVSYNYYDDPGFTWLIWFANNTIDPYFDMPLSDDELIQHIIAKYGSLDLALRKISHYRQNWYSDETKLSVTDYENLQDNFKKYYDPVIDGNRVVYQYKRKPEDVQVTTNKIIAITYTGITSNNFTVGEELRVSDTKRAFCTSSNSTVAYAQHVTGQFSQGDVIIGYESGTQATVSTSSTIKLAIPDGTTDPISNTALPSEMNYWEPVTFYDYEIEQNDIKKEIQLLDVRYKGQADDELRRAMQTR